MKKVLALFLALWMSLAVFSVTGSADSFAPQEQADVFAAAAPGDTVDLIVYDLLKLDTDPYAEVCRSIVIFFQNQFRNYDETKTITFLDGRDNVVAVCKPRIEDNRTLDLYTPDGGFGVVLSPSDLYYLTIPEGAYYTDDGILCAAYRGAYDGVYLTSTQPNYRVCILGIRSFSATQYDDTRLYTGRLRVSSIYDTCKTDLKSVILYRIDGDKRIEVGMYPIAAFDKKKGADIAFGGVKIDRFASYVLHVNYGTFTGSDNVISDHAELKLTGKKLLNRREDYPALDLLIQWFGAKHWTLKAVVYVLKGFTFLKLMDKALAKDIEKYISDRK